MLVFFIPEKNPWGQITETRAAHQEATCSQFKVCRPCTHPDPCQQILLWTIARKLLTNIPPGWNTWFLRGMSLLCSPLPGKAIKLFLSTSPKTLSLWFNLVLVHRGWVLGNITAGWDCKGWVWRKKKNQRDRFGIWEKGSGRKNRRMQFNRSQRKREFQERDDKQQERT